MPDVPKNTATTNEDSDQAEFDPVKFIRGRRPELFSDSQELSRPQLSHELLEYHLNTLTNRKQETEFEYFCRRLAEKEICPNLRPQTGPTGGGDSKADSETIPVSSEISTLWIGSNPEAGNERWAFAFSAKKSWKEKVRSDVAAILGTGRDYKRIYFITNQFARDKTRANLEDELERKHNIPVCILDRTWILKCVFENDRTDLAIEALGLTGLSVQRDKKVGPRDVEREQELQDLEADINDTRRYEGARYQLAEDCLRAAFLARGLEKPRTEVEGYFARAERIADQVQHRQQLFRIAYQRAWTAFWWYGDFDELNRLYDKVEQYAAGSSQADDVELVLNLWQVLTVTVRRGALDKHAAKHEERTAQLKAELDRLAGDDTRPNNALQAQTNRLLISLNEEAESGDSQALERVWVEFGKVIKDAENLGDYPFEQFSKLIGELGDLVPDSQAFDELFENVARVIEARRGEGEGGMVLHERGFQKLKSGKPYEAIRMFGRAQQRFIKREYREQLVSALMGCSCAYDQVGLPWAARNCALAAIERCLAYYMQDGTIIRPLLPCLQKLIWSELELGRVPQVLEVIELSAVIIPQLKLSTEREKKLQDERQVQDAILGLLMLRSSIEQLPETRSLPDILEQMGLFLSKMALLHALGCSQELREEGFIPSDEPQEEVENFFRMWLEQPAAEQVPDLPNLMLGEAVQFQSNVLGCDLRVRAANNGESICLTEALLGAIEAFLATSLDSRIAPFRQEAQIIVRPSDRLTTAPTTSIREIDGEPTIEILHPTSRPTQSLETRTAYKDALQSAIVQIMCHIAVVDDAENYFARVAGKERAFGRALNFSEVSILTANVFGPSPKFRLTDWTSGRTTKEYPLKRSRAWNCDLTEKGMPKRRSDVTQPGSGPIPSELRAALDTLPHRKRRVLSLIDIPLWDKAQWCATVYIQDPSKNPPLLLGLGFRDPEAARAIFAGWRKRLGSLDAKNQLRVSILTGVDKSNPHAYNIVIGTNLPQGVDHNGTFMLAVSRINRMTPQNSQNLDRFLLSHQELGRYVIAPAHMDDRDTLVGVFGDMCIEKSDLIVRPAWQVGENDPDIMGIVSDDDPIIPPDVRDAPVKAVLKRREAKPDCKNHS